jgi:hypothetical protein
MTQGDFFSRVSGFAKRNSISIRLELTDRGKKQWHASAVFKEGEPYGAPGWGKGSFPDVAMKRALADLWDNPDYRAELIHMPDRDLEELADLAGVSKSRFNRVLMFRQDEEDDY